MKDIQVIRGKFYISRLIEEGEHEHQDFKFQISDARKIARSISAFANNDGGRLLIGVKDNGKIVGVRNEEDIYMIEHAAESYCVPPQQVEMNAYAVEGGLVVLQASIPKATSKPVFCLEENNRRVAYFRVKDENIVAHSLMVEAWKLRENGSADSLLSAADMHFLKFLDENGSTDREQYMLSTHVSHRAATVSIVKMLAMGIVEMYHTSTGFKIRRTDNI